MNKKRYEPPIYGPTQRSDNRLPPMSNRQVRLWFKTAPAFTEVKIEPRPDNKFVVRWK
jgi:hypothetical protein